MTLASIAAGCDSVMLEVHPDPENSAVDPLQPIDFGAFSNLMGKMEQIASCIGRSLKDE
jgi:3-deoxy-7-phosphoheptulonate synthase